MPILDLSCVDQAQRSGRFLVTSSEIKAELFSFGPRPRAMPPKDPILTLETGKIVTLFGSWPRFFASTIHAQHALIGNRAWDENYRVAAAEFCRPAAKGSLAYNQHRALEFEENVQTERVYQDRLQIVEVAADGIVVRLNKNQSVFAGRIEEISRDPTWISVTFSEPVPLADIFQVLFHVQIFFELSEGRPCRRVGQAVSTRQHTEATEFDHDAYFSLYVPETPSVENPEFYSEPAFRVFRDVDRAETTRALTLWLNRRKQWDVTYWLAYQFINGGNIYDRSRMLKAMAWFESIPTYQVDSGITDAQLKDVRKAARQESCIKALGISDKRLSEVVNSLKQIPLVERFEKAIADILNQFGDDILPETIIGDCKLAKRFRDEAAHGARDRSTDPREYFIAMAAVETVAYLATMRELGISKDIIRKLTNRFGGGHPYTRYYEWADSRTRGHDDEI
ncbi:hypothetical protein [Mesorhizobium sp.]|uniref:hypothetical protein n=1 Tax=Mesorhizobium sp. TaxID=1871066 RepID=UPI0011FF4654|nr:hypothetical protein [Mesorhizobium sp.]TIN09391.1 MAG: hypothetical protein E5Y14_15720 [Mesorhizobium sp.]